MSGDSLIVGLNRVHHRENSLADGTGNNRIVSDNPRGLKGSTQYSVETHKDHRHNRTSHLSGNATSRELTRNRRVGQSERGPHESFSLVSPYSLLSGPGYPNLG